MNQLVRVSEAALREMVLATIEAYQLRRERGRQGVEIYGHLWGHKRMLDKSIVCYYVDSFSMSSTAEGDNEGVDPNDHALELKQEVMKRWFPNLYLLGDFHSHPYDDLAEVNKVRGYHFSDEDRDHFLSYDAVWEAADDQPLMLAMTIAKLKRVRETFDRPLTSNIERFDVGEFRFWLNAAAGHVISGSNQKRKWSANKRSTVILECFTNSFNQKGDRIIAKVNK